MQRFMCPNLKKCGSYRYYNMVDMKTNIDIEEKTGD